MEDGGGGAVVMGSFCLMCVEFQFYKTKGVLEMDDDGTLYLILLNCTLKKWFK